MKTLPARDVVIIGGGWTGLLMAKELGTRASLSVLVLERGPSRSPEQYGQGMDELDYAIRLRMMQDPSHETVTLRHEPQEQALPLRQFASFLPGAGLGGAGEHWNGTFPRMLPDSFQTYSRTVEKYGKGKLPENHTVQDWGVTYDELEPYYWRAELLLGISGKAGNLRGERIEGGNIFEGWRSAEYPTPPPKLPYFPALFGKAAQSLGFHPYPNPAATISQTYTNPDGVSRPACTYCGFCERFGCMIGAKAQPTNLLLPVIRKRRNVSLRTGTQVRRLVCDKVQNKSRVRGVTYLDSSGEEFFQPADLVFLACWTLNNTRLLLLSGLGEAYDPGTGKGVVGRNLTHQVNVPAVTLFFEQPLNRFMGSGATGLAVSDFNGDVFDHSGLPFLRGGNLLGLNSGNRPIASFGTVPESVKSSWGRDWKKESLFYYDRTARIVFEGEHLPHRDNFMDLDPTYKDRWGDPLLRLTLDWHPNERKMVAFGTDKAVELARALGVRQMTRFPGLDRYDATRYQSTHVQGGTIMGPDPESSVVNPYSQHWQARNLFILGASTFPQNSASNPTPTLLALALRTADAVLDRYLKSPGALA